MKAIAQSYWRSIKRGVRLFSDVPSSVAEDVKALARTEVENGTISEAECAAYFGEAYGGTHT